MYSFFVLGLIPGTSIQITFEMWIFVVADVAVLMLLAQLIGNRRRQQLLQIITSGRGRKVAATARQLHPRA